MGKYDRFFPKQINVYWKKIVKMHRENVLWCCVQTKLEKSSREVVPTTLSLTYRFQLRSAFQSSQWNCFSQFHSLLKAKTFSFYDLELWPTCMTSMYERDLNIGQDELICQISTSKLILIDNFRTHKLEHTGTQTHTRTSDRPHRLDHKPTDRGRIAQSGSTDRQDRGRCQRCFDRRRGCRWSNLSRRTGSSLRLRSEAGELQPNHIKHGPTAAPV